MTSSPKKSPPKPARFAALLLLAAGFVYFLMSRSPTEAPPEAPTQAPAASASGEMGPRPAPPDPSFVALLDGLAVGDEVSSGWKVVNFYPTGGPLVWVELQKGNAFFSVGVGPKGTGKPPPPTQTEFYEVGYGMARPPQAAMPQNEVMAAVEAVAQRIRRREKDVARPKGF